jgi:hypothetical protein
METHLGDPLFGNLQPEIDATRELAAELMAGLPDGGVYPRLGFDPGQSTNYPRAQS